ncbi:MAG TPA: hypothetical protein PKC49_10840 [Phycisphaerae bacterium]|nr:hypothetical protein [Phycisphaerae bacterium]
MSSRDPQTPMAARSSRLAAGRLRACLAIALAAAATGCSTRDDPHYNVYAPNQGRPSLMQSADRLNSRLDQGLSDLDTRLDRLLD